jgi:hypothetical protein
VLTVILLAAVVFVPVPGSQRWVGVLHDFGHAPIFGCIAVAILLLIRTSSRMSSRPAWQRYLAAFLAAIFLGALTEIVQFVGGRDASWIDMRSDVLGAAAFLALTAALDTSFGGLARSVSLIAALVLLVWHSMPALAAMSAYQRRANAFPTLVQFADRRDLYFVQPVGATGSVRSLPVPWAKDPGERALHVTFADAKWPGVDFFEPSPDWSDYRILVLDLVNPTDETLRLVLRAHDAHHNKQYSDRFNERLQLAARSRNAIRIPLADIASAPRGRPMDLQQMADFHLFRVDESTATQMYVVEVRLE